MRYIINWQHYIIILLNCCNIFLYIFLVHSSYLRSSCWRCIIYKILNVYRIVINWFLYDRIFAHMVASNDSVFICIIFICFMPKYLYLVRLRINLNFYSNLFFIHFFIFGNYYMSILMKILLWLCQNYCIWIRRSFYKRWFRLKCILLIVIVTCWMRERSQFQYSIYIRGLINLKTSFKFGPAHSGYWWEINSFTISVVRR